MIVKKYYLRIVFLFVLFAIPFCAKAECTYNEKVRLQELAQNVNFSYRHTETEYSVTFQIIISNLTNEIYMIDRTNNKIYSSNNEDIIIDGYSPGQTLKFDFYAKRTDCTKTNIFTNYLTLPSYNRHYKNELCKGIEEFKLCQKWLKNDMTYQEFYDGVMEYKNKPTEEKPEEPTTIEEFDWEKIIDIWAKYYVYILLTIIIAGGLAMYFYDKKTDL